MSSTVDSRVVEMRFDNSHFERNVSTTMSTLDKLKQKLNLSGASKGLEDVNAAAKHVDMSSLGGAVDTVKAKFSALDIVAITALTNITNSAVNAGKKLVSSLTIDQVTAGWGKFSDKTKSVATLVAQGNAIEDVNAQLSRLNWYTDETSYNFTDMVSNIAKFTATGKGLEESVTAMEGIANWAAVSGQNAATASRAMYQLSQAMGAGVLRLEDYKSIQNASMDTEEFRQKCIDAAIELKTLKKVGNDTYSSLVATGKAGAEAFNISQFTTHLTDGAWLTSEVMMKVFNDYSAAVNGIYEAAEEKGMLASEIIDEIHTTAEQAGISTDEAIKKLGYSFDSFALKAFEAAQKARTFEDAIDSVKDAVSTGWMNTFELIFGDAEGATKLWTDVANQLYDIFATGGERRNEILTDAMLPKWDQLITRINDAGIETDTFEKKIIECAKAGGVNVDDLIKKYGSLSDVFKNGKLDTDYLKEALDKLTGANEEAAKSTESVGKAVKGLSVDFTNIFPGKYGESTVAWGSDAVESVKKVQTALTELGYSLPVYGIDGIFERETWEAVAAFQKDAGLAVTGIVDQKTIDAMVKAGESLERVGEAAEGTGNKLKGTKVEIDDLVDGISHLSGRELVFNTIHNTLEGIVKIISTFRDAWADVFPTDRVASGLHSFLEMIHSVSEAFILSDNNAKKLQSTFKGVIAIFDILTSIVGGALKAAFDVIGAVFDTFGFNILTITSNIGDVISAFRDWLVENELISKIFGKVVDGAKAVIGIVKGWVNAFTNIPIVRKVLLEIQRAFTRFSLSAKDMDHAMKKVVEWLKSLKDLPIVQKILEKLQSAFTSFIDYLPVGISKLKEWFDAFKQTDGVQHLISAVEDLIDAFKKLFNGEIDPSQFATMLGDSLGRVLKSLLEIIDQFTSKFTKWFDAFKQTDGVQHLISAVEDLIDAFKKLINGDIDFSEFGTMLVKGLGSALISLPEIALQLASDFIAGFQNGLADGVSGVISKIVEFCTNFISAFKAALGIHSPSVIAYEDGVNFIQGFINGLKSMVGAVIDFLKEIGEKIIEFFKGIWDKVKAVNDKIDWNKVFAIGMLIGVALFLKKVADAFSSVSKLLSSASGVLDSVKGVISNFGGVLKSFSKVLDGISWDFKAKAMIKMAIAIGILVAAILAIVYFAGDDYRKLWNAVGVVAALAIIIAGLAFAMSKISASSMSIGKNGINVDGLKTAILQIGIAVALIAFAVKILGNLDDKTAKDGFTRLGVIAVGMLVFIGALSAITKHGGDVSGIGSMMTKMAIAIALMAIVCKLISKLSIGEMAKGAIFIAGFTIFVKYLVKATKIGEKESIAKLSGLLLSVSLALILMVAVCKLASKLSLGEIVKGAAFMAGFIFFIKYLVKATKLGGKESIAKIGGMLLSVSLAMILMIGVCKLAAKLSVGEIIKGTAFMAGFIFFIKYLIKATKIGSQEQIAKVSATILAMSVAIGILAGVAILLGLIDLPSLAKGIVAVGILSAMMTLMVRSLKGAQNAKGAIMMMAIAIGVMAAAIFVLSKYTDTKKMLASAAGLATVMAAFSLMIKSLKGLKSKDALKGALSLLALMVPIAAFAAILYFMGDVSQILTKAIALTAGIAAMTGLLYVLKIIGGSALKALEGIGLLLLLVGELELFVLILNQASGINNIEKTVVALCAGMAALVVLLGLLTVIGAFGLSALAGVVSLVAMMGSLWIFVKILGSIDGIEGLETKIKALVTAMGAMVILLGVLTVVGVFGLAALVGIGLLAVLMIAIAGLGAAMEKWPSLAATMDRGIEALTNVAEGLGGMVGAFINGLAKKVGTNFTDMLESLSTAIDKLAEISGKASNIDTKSFNNITDLLGVINTIGKTSVKTSFRDWLVSVFDDDTQSAMKKFANDGVALFEAMDEINEKASAMEFDTEAFEKIIDAANKLSSLRTNLVNAGFRMKLFGHSVVEINTNQTLKDFGTECKAFIDNMAQAFAGLKDDKGQNLILNTTAMNQIIKAGEDLSKIQGNLKASTEKLSYFGIVVREKNSDANLTSFGTNAKTFIDNMTQAFAGLRNEEGQNLTLNTTAMSQIIKAGEDLSKMQGNLTSSTESISYFGEVVREKNSDANLTSFGTNAKAFIDNMTQAFAGLRNEEGQNLILNTTAMDQIIDAGTKLAGIQGSLTSSTESISYFGEVVREKSSDANLTSFGTNAKAFIDNMTQAFAGLRNEEGQNLTLNTTAMDQIITAGTKLKDLQEKLSESVTSISVFGAKILEFSTKENLKDFGTNCSEFISSMVTAFSSLKGENGESITIDASAVGQIIEAATELAGLEESLTGVTGVVKFFTGEQDLSDFGDNIEEFAQGMTKFSNASTDFNFGAFSVVMSAVLRLKKFAEDCNDLDLSGLTNLTGGEAYGSSSPIEKVAIAMANFGNKIAEVNVDDIAKATTSAMRLKNLINSLADLKTTGVENFKPDSIGKSIKAYSDSVAGFDIEAVTSSITAAGRLKSLINSLVDLDNSGITMFTPVRIGNSIKAYANSVAGIDLAAIISSVIAANRIKSLINSLADLDNSGIARFTPISVGKSIKGYSDAVSGINLAAISNSIIAASKIRSFISSLSSLKTTGVSSFSSAVNELSQVNFSGVSSTIDSYAETMQTSGQALMTNLSAGVQAGLGGLITAVNGALTKAVGNIRSRVGLFRSSGAALARGAASGFSSNIGSLTSAASSAASTAASSIRGYRSSFFSAGEYLVRGFANGITLYTYIAEQAAKNMANKAAESAKSALQQHSPSRVFMEIGKYTVKGFAIGLNSLGNEVEDSARGMAAKAITTTRTAMATMLDTLNSDMDAQPTIKPVIDLSDVRTGVDAISGMFTGSQTIGVRSNIDAINMAMNDARQNGGNRDVISAINKLGDGLENVKGDTYNFGGFTYDDGSNVSDAVETLIRYARIGRRR